MNKEELAKRTHRLAAVNTILASYEQFATQMQWRAFEQVGTDAARALFGEDCTFTEQGETLLSAFGILVQEIGISGITTKRV